MSDRAWEAIFKKYKIDRHDFFKEPFYLSAQQIKNATQTFKKTGEKETRILCKQDTREKRPKVFTQRKLFILPVKNGHYALVRGEGYVDIPNIGSSIKEHRSILEFEPESSVVGDSEMQHLDLAYASSMVRTFCEDDTLILTIRGRKYTSSSGFDFRVGGTKITVKSVQTEVDAGYEGKNQLVLLEAKNSKTQNTIIRQLFYPYKHWSQCVKKKVRVIFFERRGEQYMFWEFKFSDADDYNSISLVKKACYEIRGGN